MAYRLRKASLRWWHLNCLKDKRNLVIWGMEERLFQAENSRCRERHEIRKIGEKYLRNWETLSMYGGLCCVLSRSVMSNSLWIRGLEPARLLSMGILQARILEWLVMPSSSRSSQSRDWTQVSHIAGGFFTIWATREALEYIYRWGEWCEMKLKTEVQDLMSLFLAGLGQEIVFYLLSALGSP